ncbi:unnamed protein product [Phytophthora lilii]|uniref:Unnamed protein product n=1 Tax=Phytophthora lilii TaxID=2077276 RepID=A0A9W6U5I2_9STRA|nr:unnamed protein product [Phytophthora lilii]
MTDATLDIWTQDTRLAILLHCLQHFADTSTAPDRSKWAQEWGNALQAQSHANPELLNLYPDELWKILKQHKYWDSELLKLCGLRCYATGLLSVGLRDRSVADTVVNNDTPLKLLKRARMYASKLEKERQQALKYIQDHPRLATSRHKKARSGGGSAATKATTPQRSLKRKHSDAVNRTPVHGNEHSDAEAGVNMN